MRDEIVNKMLNRVKGSNCACEVVPIYGPDYLPYIYFGFFLFQLLYSHDFVLKYEFYLHHNSIDLGTISLNHSCNMKTQLWVLITCHMLIM